MSSHSWVENNEEIRARIFELGGMFTPFNGRPSNIARNLEQWGAEMAEFPYPVGVGIGTDVMGVAGQTSSDEDIEIFYPFRSPDGLASFSPPKTGNRSFDYQSGGMEHYGLLAEWVENLRKVDEREGSDAMSVLMNSAEAYVQMWERAEAAAAR